jgi:membrane protease YdiL (CAAX protease family)
MIPPGSNGFDHPENPPPKPGILKFCFRGQFGLRAGWRLLIFLTLFLLILIAAFIAGSALNQKMDDLGEPTLPHIVQESLVFLCALLASFVMAKIEKRNMSEYGLPWRRMFRTRFWQGAALGFTSLSALLLAMWVAGLLHFAGVALHGTSIWTHASSFALVFLLVGLEEEFLSRGYFLFTLSSGIGFWSAAILSSALFACLHFGPTETWTGRINAGLLGLFFCLLLRKTGDLWMSVGYHAAWDWGQTYFFSVPDSGQMLEGHLLNSTISGQAWLSGATVGPEGSLLCTLLLVASWLVVWRFYRTGEHP